MHICNVIYIYIYIHKYSYVQCTFSEEGKGRQEGRKRGEEVQGREVRKTEKEDSVQHADIPDTQGRRIFMSALP